MRDSNLPTLNELGRDLLIITPIRRLFLLSFPFLLSAGYFILASFGFWFLAVIALVLLSFFTYGSISHDLVHANLNLPKKTNSFLLSTIELLTLRSGHAYRIAHLNHHIRYPNDDDIEGAASKMSFARTLLEGVIFHPKICIWAYRKSKKGSDRFLVTIEIILSLCFICLSIAVLNHTSILFIYAALMIGGSWIIPLITSYIPHAPYNHTEVFQTRLFRGRVLSILALEHLYHLEHHLYPAVPHSNWPKLAKRLDPYFNRIGLRPVKLWF